MNTIIAALPANTADLTLADARDVFKKVVNAFPKRREACTLTVFTRAEKEGDPDVRHDVSLYRGVWVEAFGLRIQLLDEVAGCQQNCSFKTGGVCSASACTRILIEAEDTLMPMHYHDRDERYTLVQGRAFDPENNVLLMPGQEAVHHKGEWHSLHIDGMLLVCWHPPLAEVSTLP